MPDDQHLTLKKTLRPSLISLLRSLRDICYQGILF